MIEANAFLAVFIAQIVVFSVMFPPRLISRARAAAMNFPAERFAQLYPGVDHRRALERYVTGYRIWNAVNVVAGLVLLGWFFSYLRQPDWDDGPVEALCAAYSILQMSPLLFAAVLDVRYSALLERLLDGKRTALLKRRELFDFVSPYTVFLAALCYFLYVAYVLYITQHPFPGFAGPYVNIGMMTVLYAMLAFAVYTLLYRKKVDPTETHAARERAIGMGVRLCVYMCILNVFNTSVNYTLVLQDLQRWEPAAQGAGLLLVAFFIFRIVATPPRRPRADGLQASEAS